MPGTHPAGSGVSKGAAVANRTLTCPGCAREMHVEVLSKVEVDHCVACLGTYLDADELGRLRAREEADSLERPPTLDATLEPPAAQELGLWALLMGGTSA